MKESKRPISRVQLEEEREMETPRLLSSEEKRELILAHARTQTGKDRMQRMTVWAGVFVVVAGVAVGWWWTVGSNLQVSFQEGSPELQNATKRLDEFTKTVQQGTNSLQKPLSPTNQAEASEFSDVMKAVIEGNQQPKGRNDLLAPHPSASTTSAASASSSEQTEPAQLIDPSSPGLTPDSQSSN